MSHEKHETDQQNGRRLATGLFKDAADRLSHTRTHGRGHTRTSERAHAPSERAHAHTPTHAPDAPSAPLMLILRMPPATVEMVTSATKALKRSGAARYPDIARPKVERILQIALRGMLAHLHEQADAHGLDRESAEDLMRQDIAPWLRQVEAAIWGNLAPAHTPTPTPSAAPTRPHAHAPTHESPVYVFDPPCTPTRRNALTSRDAARLNHNLTQAEMMDLVTGFVPRWL